MSDLKAIAAKPLFADLSLNIYTITNGIDDEVEYGYSNDTKTSTSVVQTDPDTDRLYFVDNNNEKQYLDDFIRIDEGKSADVDTKHNSEKSCIYEAITDADIEKLSQLNVTEDELTIILNLLEFVDSEQKDNAISLINLLFENKKLEPVESEDEVSASERYTRMLLDGGRQPQAD